MFKRCLIVIACIALLLSFTSCSKDGTQQNNGESNQAGTSTTNGASKEDSTTSNIPADKDDTNETNNMAENPASVFKTDNIIRITFYAYYGSGKGSDVPAEHLDEIKTWLNSFEIDSDRTVPELLPPGTNTIHVEIEYSDGSIVKQGMDTAVINGVTYYISGDSSPECYNEIISKTSLN